MKAATNLRPKRSQAEADAMFLVADRAARYLSGQLPDSELTRAEKLRRVGFRQVAPEWTDYRAVLAASEQGMAKAARQQASIDEANRRLRAEAENEADIPRRLDAIHGALTAAGAVLEKKSESGSRYYRLGARHVRVSDHEPNAATQHWIDRCGAEIIRVDRRRWEGSLEYVLSSDD